MELKSGDKVIVNLGRNFAGSLVKATFKEYDNFVKNCLQITKTVI